jgi:hypothetical protein
VDEILQMLQGAAGETSLYVMLILAAMQVLKSYVVPVDWWTGPHEDKLRLLPLVFGILAHVVFDVLPWRDCIQPGIADGFIALGVFNGTKIVRKLGGG